MGGVTEYIPKEATVLTHTIFRLMASRLLTMPHGILQADRLP